MWGALPQSRVVGRLSAATEAAASREPGGSQGPQTPSEWLGLQRLDDVRRAQDDLRTDVKEQIAEVKEHIAGLRTDVKEQIAEVKEQFSDLRTEVKEQIAELKEQFSDLRAEVKEQIAEVKEQFSDLRADMKALDGKMERQYTTLDGKIDRLRTDQRWFIGVLCVAIIGLLAKLFLPAA